MHDFSLGAPVDVGEYEGPMVDGEPLHRGSCEDGVYGCRRCSRAARMLPPDKLKELGWGDQPCAWCKKMVRFAEICEVRPWDEPSCYYEICRSCRAEYDYDLRQEVEHWRTHNY